MTQNFSVENPLNVSNEKTMGPLGILNFHYNVNNGNTNFLPLYGFHYNVSLSFSRTLSQIGSISITRKLSMRNTFLY